MLVMMNSPTAQTTTRKASGFRTTLSKAFPHKNKAETEKLPKPRNIQKCRPASKDEESLSKAKEKKSWLMSHAAPAPASTPSQTAKKLPTSSSLVESPVELSRQIEKSHNSPQLACTELGNVGNSNKASKGGTVASWFRRHLRTPSKYPSIRGGAHSESSSSTKSQKTVSQASSTNIFSTTLQHKQNQINRDTNQSAGPIVPPNRRTRILRKMRKMVGLKVDINPVEDTLLSDLELPNPAEKPVDSSSPELSSTASSLPSDTSLTAPNELEIEVLDALPQVGMKKEKEEEEEEESTSQTSSKGSRSVHSVSDNGSHGSNSTFMYSHEPFEDFKLKIIQLCCDIRWGEPSEVEHIKGGSYHRIIGVKFNSRQPQDYVFRIARMQEERDLSKQVKDEVAIHQYLSQLLPIPKVAASDETKNNVLQCSYILQERIPGKCQEAIFYKLSLAEKLHITTKVAELIQKMEAIKFEKPGRLAASSNTSVLLHKSSNHANNIEIAGFREGKMAVEGDWPLSEAQPFKQLMIELFTYQREQYDDGSNEYSMEYLDKLVSIAEQMEAAGLMRNIDMQCALWHWDFAGRNVMIEAPTDPECLSTETKVQLTETAIYQPKSFHHKIQIESGMHKTSIMVELPAGTNYKHSLKITDASTNSSSDHSFDITTPQPDNIKPIPLHNDLIPITPKKWEISGVLDWDNVLSVPLVISRQPPQWLWCEEENRSSEFTGNFDISPARELTQDELLIKGHFDQIMSRADPTYIEDAYGRGVWLRRLARMALDGFGGYGGYERAEALQKEWEKYFTSICGLSVKGKGSAERRDGEEDGPEEESEDDSDMEDGEVKKDGEDTAMKDDGEEKEEK